MSVHHDKRRQRSFGHRRAGFLFSLVLTVALQALLLPFAHSQTQPTLLQRLREMLGIQRPISVGGSRASLPTTGGGGLPVPPMAFIGALTSPAPGALSSENSKSDVCLLSPWLQQPVSTLPRSPSPGPVGVPIATLVAVTPSGSPPIVSRDPLVEVQILQGSTLRWQGRGSATTPLANPLAWPLPPLQPGESIRLKLRRAGTEDGSFAEVELHRPSPVTTATSGAVSSVERLQMLLDEGRSAEAIELLFKGDLAGNPALRDLGTSVMATGCTTLSTTAPYAW
jgi:hypothetical protein